jgi:EmrB/QacA subfamily drug resistance transporter
VTVVNVALADIRHSFGGPDLVAVSWCVTAYAAAFAAALVPAGRLADALGHRRMLIAGTSTFVLASTACAAAPSLPVLVAARLGQAIGAGLAAPASFGLLLREMPRGARSNAVAIWSAAAATSAFLGPSLGGLLVEAAGWRALFALDVPVGSVLLAYYIWRAPRPRAAGGAPPDPLSVVLLSAGIALVVVALTQAGVWGWTDALTLTMAAVAVLGMALAMLRSAVGHAPLIDFDLLSHRSFATANAVSLVFALAAFAWLLAGPLFATSVWGYGALAAALSVTPGALTAAITSLLVGGLSPRGRARAIVAGAVLFAATSCVLAATLGDSPRLLVWIVAGALEGAAIGGVLAALSATVANAVPPDRFGAGAAINITARQLGGSLGVALLAALVGATGGAAASDFTVVWLVGAAAGLMAAVGALPLLRPAMPGGV